MGRGFKDLIVWQKAMDLVEETYRVVKCLPKEEQYGLSNQMRRAVVSIPSNIAEGNQRGSIKEYLHFLYIAMGSLGELETQIISITANRITTTITTNKIFKNFWI